MSPLAIVPPCPAWFWEAMSDFLANWRQPMDRELARVYFSTLSDCEQGDIEAAGLELRRSAGGEWPPSASTWHETAVRLSRARVGGAVWAVFLDALPVNQWERGQWFERLSVVSDDGRVLTVRADGLVIAYLARHYAPAISAGLIAAGRDAIDWVPNAAPGDERDG